jgi:hypothetical protein
VRPREAFLSEAIEIHRAYDKATDALRQLSREKKAFGPEWEEVNAHQQQLLNAWSALSLKYGDFKFQAVSVERSVDSP